MTTAEVMAATGVTKRQINYWIRRGYIPGQINGTLGSGDPRRWTPDDVARVIEVRDAFVDARERLAAVGIEVPNNGRLGFGIRR